MKTARTMTARMILMKKKDLAKMIAKIRNSMKMTIWILMRSKIVWSI